jgi:hypothetical protein
MNKKIIALSSIVLLLAFGFLYMNSGKLIASGKSYNKKCCVDQSTSTTKQEIKAGGDEPVTTEYAKYEFTTDKACCNEMKSAMQKQIMGAGGVKDVKFSETCSASKMTMVTVLYLSSETNVTQLASYLKDKNIDCPVTKDCDKEGCSKQKAGGNKDCPNGVCPHNNKKTSTKEI